MFDLWPEKIWQNFLQTSVILTVSTQCYTKGHEKEGDIDTNLRCCFHRPATLHPLLSGKSVLNDASPHLLTNGNKFSYYYIVASHQGCVHCFVYNVKEQFCIGCIQQHWREYHIIYTDVDTLHPPPPPNYVNFLLISPGTNTTMECVTK